MEGAIRGNRDSLCRIDEGLGRAEEEVVEARGVRRPCGIASLKSFLKSWYLKLEIQLPAGDLNHRKLMVQSSDKEIRLTETERIRQRDRSGIKAIRHLTAGLAVGVSLPVRILEGPSKVE